MENSAHHPRLLTAGEAAAVLHRSATTIGRWAREGKIEVANRASAGAGGGLYLFDPRVVAEKALELALGKQDPSGTLFADEPGGES